MTGSLATILVVEDEAPIRRVLRIGLTAMNYTTLEAPTGRSGLDLIEASAPDLVILDLGLPDMPGLTLIRTLRGRANMTPILVLSSRDDEDSKVQALDLGADDYLAKPAGIREVQARVRTALRHRLQQQGETPVFRAAGLEVDLVRRIVAVRGRTVKLSPREYDILRLMVKHAGKVLTHKLIQDAVWGREVGVQYVRIYVRALRLKLEAIADRPEYILTELGVGYRLRAPD
jgi:two-component system KDP operon response regulator KdpE